MSNTDTETSAAPPPSTTATTVKTPYAAPTKYDGKKENYETFRRQLMIYLRGNTSFFDSDEKKILCALSYLEGGNASKWANAYTDLALADEKEGFKTWEFFLGQMDAIFGSYSKETDAITELESLYQGKKTAHEYWLSFFALLVRAKLDPEKDYKMLRRIVITRMNQPLIAKCAALESPPKTLDDWKDKTIIFDTTWREYLEIQGVHKRSTERTTSSSTYTPKKKDDNNDLGEPMDIDAKRTTREPRAAYTRMTDIERADLMKAGKCFNCHNQGHISRDCPTKKNRPRVDNRATSTKAPTSSTASEDKDAVIASLMDKIALMEKAMKEKEDF